MLVVQEFVSVDGYAADADGRYSFGGVIPDWSDIDAGQAALLQRTGRVVLGRTTYEHFVAAWPDSEHVLAPAINGADKVVISQRRTDAPWGRWPAATVASGPLPQTIERLGQAATPLDLLVWGSLALTAALLRAGLVDQLRLIVCPVVLGAGIGVVPADLGPTALRLVESRPYPNGALQLVYQVRGPARPTSVG